MSFFKKLTKEFEELGIGSKKERDTDEDLAYSGKRDFYPPPQQQAYGEPSPTPGYDTALDSHQSPPALPQTTSAPVYSPPQDKPPIPSGWVPEWDQEYQRWYYHDTATGRSQWEAPGQAQSDDNRGVDSGYAYDQYSGGGGGYSYGSGEHEYQEEKKKKKKSSGYGGVMLGAAGGLVAGAVIADALDDSSDDEYRHAPPPPVEQSYYAPPPPVEQSYYSPPPPVEQSYYPPPPADLSESDRESLEEAREEYQEALDDARSSSASSSDLEELEEAREEYEEELEEAYDD